MGSLFKAIVTLFIVIILFRLGLKKGKEQVSARLNEKRPSGSALLFPKDGSAGSAFRGGSQFGRSDLLINGVPAQMNVYLSKKSIGKEIASYEKQWVANGYEIQRTTIGKMQIVNAFNKNARLLESVIVTNDPRSQKTLVIPSKLDFTQAPVQSKYKTPLHPLTQPIFHIESSDMGVFSETIIALSDASVPSVVDFYRNRFSQSGWHLDEPDRRTFIPPNHRSLLFLKGPDELWVNAGRIEDKNKTFVYLLYNDKH